MQESNPWTGYHDEVLEALPSLFQPPVRVFMPGADAGEAFTWGAPKHTNSCGQEMWAKYTQEAQDKPSEKKIMDLITSLSNENSLMEVLPRLVEPIEDDTAHLPSYDVPAPPLVKLGQVFVDRTFSAFEGSDKIPESVKQILSKELELDTTLLMQGGDGAVAMVHKIQDGFRLGIVIDCDNQTINYAESRHRTSATKADENLRRSLVAKPIQGNRLVRVLGASDWSDSIPLAEHHAPSLFEFLPSESSIPWLEFSSSGKPASSRWRKRPSSTFAGMQFPTSSKFVDT